MTEGSIHTSEQVSEVLVTATRDVRDPEYARDDSDTCRKHGVSFYKYLQDIFSNKYSGARDCLNLLVGSEGVVE